MSYESPAVARMSSQTTAPESLSLIDRYSSVDGTFTTTRDVRIEGELRGTLRCDGYVHVAEGAVVEATVEAANITVAGQLRGSIACRGKLTILNTGQVQGTITTQPWSSTRADAAKASSRWTPATVRPNRCSPRLFALRRAVPVVRGEMTGATRRRRRRFPVTECRQGR